MSEDQHIDTFVANLVAEQRAIDADRAAMADAIVAGQNIATVEEGKRFARAWRVTAAQYAANEGYMTRERDKLLRTATMDRRVERLMRQYRPGDRVRAVEDIVYGTGEEVAEGAVGHVQETGVHGCAPLLRVSWEGAPAVTQPVSAESLEPAPLDPG